MDIQIGRRLRDTIKWYSCVSIDGAGERTFTAPIDIPAYVWNKEKFSIGVDGTQIVTQITCYVDYENHPIKYNDEIALEDGRRLPIKSITTYRNPINNLKTGEVGL